ncbi:complex I subunit 4 family protein [Nitrosococcus oceani]|uniref:complex I subunit 4 family protein n=1 Tax=Nitrosococcus oceani TaxID=1229 RepID=UPI0004E8A4AC|nr:NADH-quinone oxidoreductase subunit M [Nitrosococcus oceani]KFI22977.1 oxidoreductase [Nitrosococcus oceani]
MIAEISWSAQAGFPILSTMIVLPLLAMTIALIVKSNSTVLLGIIAAALELGLAIYLLTHFETGTANLQFVERVSLLPPFLFYHLGVDGISILFVALTALLTLLLILYCKTVSTEIVDERPIGFYVASIFAFQAVLMGLFMSINLLGFWLLLALELVPAGIILHRWGTTQGPEKNWALSRYLQDMVGGIGLLLIAILLLGWYHAEATGSWSFALTDLLASPLSPKAQAPIFVLFLFGIAPRLGLFPFHAWIPIVAQHGPVATLGVFLVGLKVGLYALLRFILPLMPDAVEEWKSFIVTLAIIGTFYGAVMALLQVNLRRLLAFAVVSHTGLLIIGVFCLNRVGLEGSLLLTINFGVAASGLLFVMGIFYRSTRTTLLPRLGGLFDATPLLGFTFLIAALSTMAMPGTPGFDAAHLILEGAIATYHWSIAVAVGSGSVAAAAFLLWAFQRAFLAQRRERALQPKKIKLDVPEILLAATVCSVLAGIGFYTGPWLEMVDGSLTALSQRFETALVMN